MSDRQQYTVEFPIRAKPELVYNYLTDPSGLAAWFANDVNVDSNEYEFVWEGSSEKADLVKGKPYSLVQYYWKERDEEEHLTFEIEKDDLTGDTSIIISDYDNADELEEAKLMWESVIESLKGVIGG